MLNSKELGRRLREVRKYYNFTQTEVAEKMNLSQKTVSHIESGDNVVSQKLLLCLLFYMDYVDLNLLLSDHFDLLENNGFDTELHLDSVLDERLKLFKQEMNERIDDFKMDMNKHMLDIIKLTGKKQ